MPSRASAQRKDRASVLTIDTNPPPVFGRCGATAETLALERILSGLVNRAYALTPAEIALMWQTAPPRMPIPRPDSQDAKATGRPAGKPPRGLAI